jgi:L-ascorbate metabolism protein UlaG (beta-lactamase superfamily)
MFELLQFFLVCFVIGFILDFSLNSRGYRGPRSDHFDGKRFFNGPVEKRFNSHENRLTEFIIFSIKKLDSNVWRKRMLPAGLAMPGHRVFGKQIVVTMINHSTVLIQTEGLNILTDPVWARRASPFRGLGPKRFMDPGVHIDMLPPIDFILLSHNHYDHMDIAALRFITKRDRCSIYTPLGNSDYLKKRGIDKSFDMDWGQSKKFSDQIEISCVPARHFSARAVTDRNRTLWAGFVVHTPHGDIYFAGDTGYGSHVWQIKKIFPNGFRLAFLPIGAYEPKSFMSDVHMGPDEAVVMSRELGVKQTIPIHFGTFDMALDGQDDPENRLRDVLGRDENRDICFDVLHNGESVSIA